MTRRISVGERLAEDMLVGRWDDCQGRERVVDALFRPGEAGDAWLAERAFLMVLVAGVDEEEACMMADILVGRRKAVWANILPRVNSVFWRRDAVERAEGSLVVVKTKADLFQDVTRLVRSIGRSDDLEIVALPIVTESPEDSEGEGEQTEARTDVMIAVGDLEVRAWLNGAGAARRLVEALPLASTVSLWGGEMYFPVPVDEKLQNGRDTVNVGDIAYWPPGKAICVFLGDTPLGNTGVIRPLTPVEVIGRVEAPESLAGRVRRGERITIWR
jgi:uncharacterized protein involved in tolerance to divalent cations